jgi:hypothetical protein
MKVLSHFKTRRFNMSYPNTPAPSTTICILRHGETDWNSTGRLQGCEDIELNAVGREQAVQVAGYLEKEPWDIIISSPLKRAYETARIIAMRLSIITDKLISYKWELKPLRFTLISMACSPSASFVGRLPCHK